MLRLSDRPALSRQVIRLLPARLARDVTDDVLAHRELARLTPPQPLSAFRVGPAARCGEASRVLRGGAAPKRHPVAGARRGELRRVRLRPRAPVERLRRARADAVHAVDLGDLRARQRPRSASGDPRCGPLSPCGRRARSTSAAALHRYNPSWAYVDAIERYAGRIRRDPQAFLVFYARRLIVRTPQGYRRLTRL